MDCSLKCERAFSVSQAQINPVSRPPPRPSECSCDQVGIKKWRQTSKNFNTYCSGNSSRFNLPECWRNNPQVLYRQKGIFPIRLLRLFCCRGKARRPIKGCTRATPGESLHERLLRELHEASFVSSLPPLSVLMGEIAASNLY